MCVRVVFGSVWVAGWPPFGNELLTRLTIHSLCILTICGFGCFPFWFLGLGLGTGSFGSWSLSAFYFYYLD